MTHEQRAAIMYAQTRLRRISIQLERGLGTDLAAPIVARVLDAIQACDDAMKGSPDA